MRRSTRISLLSIGMTVVLSGPSFAQEAEVSAAVQETFAALNAGAAEAFASLVMPRAQLFLHLGYGITLREGVDSIGSEAWRAPFEGYGFDLTPRQIRVQVFGSTAVVAGYVHGQVRFPTGYVVGGPWRYSETRVHDQGRWIIAQQHFSPLGERAARVADRGFGRYPEVEAPAYSRNEGPVVLVDEAHFNLHTLWGSYRPFADFLRRDGYVVTSLAEPFTRETLETGSVLVISTAMSANLVGDQQAEPRPAFTPQEVSAVKEWVDEGGALLLIGNHYPYPAAIQDLAEAFGIRFSNCGATHPDVGSGRLMFRRLREPPRAIPDLDSLLAVGDTATAREVLQSMVTIPGDGMSYGDGGTLTEHSITAGIDSVATFLGASFQVDGPHEPLMVLGPGVACFDQTSLLGWVEGQLQGAVLESGRGRIAAFAEAGMFTSQLVGVGGTKMGMNDPIARQNPPFVLQVMHWLTRLRETP